MRHYLKLAIEENASPATIASELGAPMDHETDQHENHILEVNNQIKETFNNNQEDSAVMESLSLYATALEQFTRSGTSTKETNSLIYFGAQQQLNRINQALPVISLESSAEESNQQYQLALEGVIGQAFDRWVQLHVLNIKHSNDILFDLLSTTQMMLRKYEGKLQDGTKEFNRKKNKFKNKEHVGSLVHLWYYFSNDEGQTKDVVEALKKDLEMSSYVLYEFPNKIMDLLKQLIKCINSNKFDSIAGVKKLVNSIEALPAPTSLFKKQFIGGKPFLNVVGLELTQGNTRNVLNYEDVSFNKLSVLATPTAIDESGSFSHGVKSVAANSTDKFGAMLNTFLSATINFQTEDIGAVFDMGLDYISNVEKYITSSSEFKKITTDYISAIKKLEESTSSELSSTEITRVLKQITQYGDNIIHSYKSPATAEMARSLRGSKYCTYLGLRMIYNAT